MPPLNGADSPDRCRTPARAPFACVDLNGPAVEDPAENVSRSTRMSYAVTAIRRPSPGSCRMFAMPPKNVADLRGIDAVRGILRLDLDHAGVADAAGERADSAT